VKKIWKNHKLIIITAGYSVAILLVIVFLAVPLVNKLVEKADSIQKNIIDDQISRERVDKIPQMEELDKVYQSKKDELDVILDPNGEVDFIKKLEALADETGNKMTIKVDEAAANAKAPAPAVESKDSKKSIKESLGYDKYISIQISLKGDYAELVNFVHKLENFRYYVNIISIESKKEVEISENKITPEASKSSDIFAALGAPIQTAAPQAQIEKKEKDILASTLKVVIYTKK
jgi:hypothetical protein